MFHGILDNPSSLTVKERFLTVFSGGNGFGQILYFWALMLSLISMVALIVIGFAFQSDLAVLVGLVAGYCYGYLCHIAVDLMNKISPND